MNKYKIVWEKNSIADRLVCRGQIKPEDIVPKTSTRDFPTEAATVRVSRLLSASPVATIHIKDKKITKYYNNGQSQLSYDFGPVLRVSCEEDSFVSFNGNTILIEMKEIAYIVDYVRGKMKLI